MLKDLGKKLDEAPKLQGYLVDILKRKDTDVAQKLVDALDELGPENVEKILDRLPVEKYDKFLKELPDGSPELKALYRQDPSVADVWNKADDAGLDEALRKDPDLLESFKKIDCN